MYVVTVEFKIRRGQLAAFMPLMLENAKLSREREPGCRQFDVCADPAAPATVFLYELYDDRAAFDAHLATDHFKAFDAAVRDMLEAKTIRNMERVGG